MNKIKRKIKHDNIILFNIPKGISYQQDIFLKDKRVLDTCYIVYKNNEKEEDLTRFYPNIDIAETLSNLTGKWIRKIKEDEVEFEDGTKINIKDLDYKLIKPLIWWE